ncbi:hypothetical protein XENTR_v10020589 [Xenopus tropicalis]|nr:hypothetical protein XENTR_v10020589 [Xenopus tropicalis]
MVGGMPGMTFVNRISSLLGQCENAWWGSHTRKSTVTHRIVPACMELMEQYIRVGAHFWPDYTGGGTYHEQERRRIREELQGAVVPARQKEIPPLPEPPRLVLVSHWLGIVIGHITSSISTSRPVGLSQHRTTSCRRTVCLTALQHHQLP